MLSMISLRVGKSSLNPNQVGKAPAYKIDTFAWLVQLLLVLLNKRCFYYFPVTCTVGGDVDHGAGYVTCTFVITLGAKIETQLQACDLEHF